MFVEVLNSFIYGVIFLSLFAIDYILGHGVVDVFQTIFCKIVCVIRKTVKEEERQAQGLDNPINIPMLCTEILILFFTVMPEDVTAEQRPPPESATLSSCSLFLNKYKQYRRKDCIDELLQESKDALKQTNEFLEKWRLRRINWQVPTEYSYLDEEPQEIKPLKLEVPILHMAIIDTLGTTRSQLERGDAGDTYNITDTTLLSVTSLIEDDQESITEELPSEQRTDEDDNNRSTEYNRYLWDVMEEDSNYLEDD